MSFSDAWTIFRDEYRTYRRYQTWYNSYIPLYDDEYRNHEWIEVTTMNTPAHVRMFMRVR